MNAPDNDAIFPELEMAVAVRFGLIFHELQLQQ